MKLRHLKAMTAKRAGGYRPYGIQAKNGYPTEFDRWMREMDVSVPTVAAILDIPELRVRSMQRGWHNNKAIMPSYVTRLAMAAYAHGLSLAPTSTDCFERRDRLAEAAGLAGIEAWPAGEPLTGPAYEKIRGLAGDRRTKPKSGPLAAAA